MTTTDTTAKDQAKAQLESIVEMVEALEKGEEIDGQDPQERIQEDPLSIQVRSGWANSPEEMGAEEYTILLCTGGPAVRIIGDLDRDEPDSARIEYQDWFTPWIEYLGATSTEHKALLTYARQFYFGS